MANVFGELGNTNNKPIRRTIALVPDLDADVEAYAKVYEKAHGKKADPNTLQINQCFYTLCYSRLKL